MGDIKLKIIISLKCTLCLLIITLCYLGCNKSISYSSNQIQTSVDDYLKDKKNILGTIVKVDVQGKHSFRASSGYFDISRKTSINADDMFIIGSVTKVFTAVLIHQLVEQGKVELQKPLISYLSSNWTEALAKIKYGSEITVEHALSHRSGIADVTETEEFIHKLISEPLKAWKSIEILQLTTQQGEPRFKPGKGYDYCNTNYLLLGAIVEHVTGQPYSVSLKMNILNLAGVDNTFLSEGTFGSGKGGIAHGYYLTDGKAYDGQEVSVGWAQASGGIISTADDLIRFFKALVSQKLFEKKETFEQMVKIVGGNEQYGLGLMVVDDPDIGIYYGHGGNFCGTRTILAYFPEHQTTIVVCHTYDGYANSRPEDLIKVVMKEILPHKSGDVDISRTEIKDIFADNSPIQENEDIPELGNWDFDLKEQWSISKIDGQPIKRRFLFNIERNGEIYLMDPSSGKIFVLDPNGNFLTSFGDEEEHTGYLVNMFVTSDYINVFEIGNTVNRIKVFDKKGGIINSFKISSEISPRVFVDGEKFFAIRSGTGINKEQAYETLDLLALKNNNGSVIGKFQAEERLIASANATMGQVHIMLDDIELFPRLILHLDKNMIYVGRSGRYLIKKFDLQGNEVLAFAVNGRSRKSLPANFKEKKVAGIGLVGGKVMPDDMKKEIFDGIPEQQVFITQIATDKQGLIYVFIPDIDTGRKQEVDIFSRDGRYIYNGVIELTNELGKVRSYILDDEFLYVLSDNDKNDIRFVKYRIKVPK